MDNLDKVSFAKKVQDEVEVQKNGKFPCLMVVITIASGLGLLVAGLVSHCGN